MPNLFLHQILSIYCSSTWKVLSMKVPSYSPGQPRCHILKEAVFASIIQYGIFPQLVSLVHPYFFPSFLPFSLLFSPSLFFAFFLFPAFMYLPEYKDIVWKCIELKIKKVYIIFSHFVEGSEPTYSFRCRLHLVWINQRAPSFLLIICTWMSMQTGLKPMVKE